jgi:hypothetical protein
VEALYTFPVPKGASVANFSMWINGREMLGEVVEKERARQIYNSYKQPVQPGEKLAAQKPAAPAPAPSPARRVDAPQQQVAPVRRSGGDVDFGGGGALDLGTLGMVAALAGLGWAGRRRSPHPRPLSHEWERGGT